MAARKKVSSEPANAVTRDENHVLVILEAMSREGESHKDTLLRLVRDRDAAYAAALETVSRVEREPSLLEAGPDKLRGYLSELKMCRKHGMGYRTPQCPSCVEEEGKAQ